MKSDTLNHTNVDRSEIEKFSQLASRWWDAESEFKPLHDINPLRMDYIESQCDGLEGKKVLDIGCGGGIDMAAASLEVARLHLLESGLNIDYQKITAEQFAEDHPHTFDVITCLEMLEHVPDPASIVNAAARALKPDGTLVLSTINRNGKSFLLAIVGAEYIIRMLPRGTHEYEKFIKPSELAAAARQSKLNITDITGMSYNPLTRSYRLGQDVDVNYLMTCQPE